MLSVFRPTLVAALLAGTFMIADAGSDAWHFDVVRSLLVARIDPIVNPNAVASHAHLIMGGSNFAAGYSYENSRSSNCTSLYSTSDKSNYWTPQMYWVSNDANQVTADTTYTPLGAEHRFYYFLSRNAADIPVSPFPKGLRILAGSNAAKIYNDTGFPDDGMTYTCQVSREDLTQNTVGTSWNDFDHYCPEVKLELKFPSCWDGVNLYSDDGSHMSYPQTALYGACPLSHPTRLPAIMLEVTWQVYGVVQSGSPKGRLILANGDTTGFGTHADFSNGWDIDVLYKALNDPVCVNLGSSIAASDCPSLNINIASGTTSADACRPMRGQLVEDGLVQNVPAKQLPGCNKPWASGVKPTCDGETIATPDLTAFLGVETQPYQATSEDIVDVWEAKALSTTSSVWQDVGCVGSESFDNNRTLWYDPSAMTISNCQNFCELIGHPYAALRLGNQCLCSKILNLSGYKLENTLCNTPCSGDASSTCGADGPMYAYYKPTVKVAQPSASDLTFAGCFQDGTVRGSRDPSYEDVAGCRKYCAAKGSMYFGLANGQDCDCGDMVADGATRRVPDFECNSQCRLDSAQICGGNVKGTFFQSVYLVSGQVNVTTSDATTSAANTTATVSTIGVKTSASATASATAVSSAATSAITAATGQLENTTIALSVANSSNSSISLSSTTGTNSNMTSTIIVNGTASTNSSTTTSAIPAATGQLENTTIALSVANSSNSSITLSSTTGTNSNLTSTIIANGTASANGTALQATTNTTLTVQATGTVTSSKVQSVPTASTTSRKVCSRKRRRDWPVRLVERHQRRNARRSLRH